MTGSLIGQKVGDYEIVARVGSGGMGAVFEARHPVIGKRIAVKVLHPVFAKDPKVLDRFLNEARVVNAIGHPAIVDIFSIGQTSDGLPYFLMEFLKGQSLADVLAAEGTLAIPRALELTRQLLEVLDKAHSAGVVHRDLKPQNLFIEELASGPRLRVLDFGIAKSMTAELKQMLTGSAILGTPGYMAPEQINSEPITPRTDLFSVGAVLFELVTGRQVYAGQSVGQLLMKALYEEPPLASSVKPIPAAVDAFIARLLARESSRRPASAAEALSMLRSLDSMPLPAPVLEPVRLPGVDDRETRNSKAVRPALVLEPVRLPGVDDHETRNSKAVRPAPQPMHEVEQRTEPAYAPKVMPRRGDEAATRPVAAVNSQTHKEVEAVPEVATRPVGAVSRAPKDIPAAPHEAFRTSVDAELVQRVQAQLKQKSRWPWVLVVVLLVVTAAAGFIALR